MHVLSCNILLTVHILIFVVDPLPYLSTACFLYTKYYCFLIAFPSVLLQCVQAL